MLLTIFILLCIIGIIIWVVEYYNGDSTFFGLICFLLSVLGIIWQLLPSTGSSGPGIEPPTDAPTITAKIAPSPVPTMVDRVDDITEVTISDQSDTGFDTGLGTEHFQIANSANDNFGNTYTKVGYFSWQDYYASDGYVVFYVADYSKVTGQLVAIEGERPADNAVVKMFDDSDTEIASFTGIEKTTLPVDFSIDLTGKSFFKIYTNSQEIMYVNVQFFK